MKNVHTRQKLFNLRKFIFMFLFIFVFAAATLSFSHETAQAKAKKVSLTKKVSMTIGETKKLTLKNNKKKVKWTSRNKKVVKITKSGKKKATIKALKEGTAKVTAKIGKKKYTCKVTVKAPAEISFPKAETMTVGDTKTLALKNNSKSVTWSTSNKEIVRITMESSTGAAVKALKTGTAQITAKIEKVDYICTVTVKKGSSGPSESPDPELPDPEVPDPALPDPALPDPELPDPELPDPEPSILPESYTYSIVPLLAPFDEYFYVETENPDPSNIRFTDKESIYYTAEDTELCSIVPTSKRFLDVCYENETTGRVAGGYIFEKENQNMDGGTLTLQKASKAEGSNYYLSEYADTSVTVNCPEVKSYLQYLIDTCTTASMTFFEKMDAIQSVLDDLALYPRPVRDINRKSTATPYPLLAASPYPELSLNSWYTMYEYSENGLFLDYLYPFVLNSASFPSAMYTIAEKLEPSCTIEWGNVHYLINVTKDGVTKSYGGAGQGGDAPLYTNHVEKLFLFDGSNADYAAHANLQNLSEKRTAYGELAAADAAFYRNQIQGDLFKETVSPGSWIKVAVEGWSLAANKAFAYVTEGTQFSDDPQRKSVSSIECVWIDGRYINECNIFEKGAVFEDYPKADIVIRNMAYTDMKGIEHRGDVRFRYDEATDTWKSNAYTYGYVYNASELVLPDEFILTQDEVAELDVDKNTNTDPTVGFIYDGSAEPGTPL